MLPPRSGSPPGLGRATPPGLAALAVSSLATLLDPRRASGRLICDAGAQFAEYGTGVAGALFGAGWWVWIDAVTCAYRKIPFAHHLPGIIMTLSIILINCVGKHELSNTFGNSASRAKLWMLVSYVISMAALIGSLWSLAQNYAPTPHAWPGVAGVLQCAFILAGGLMFWGVRGQNDYGY